MWVIQCRHFEVSKSGRKSELSIFLLLKCGKTKDFLKKKIKLATFFFRQLLSSHPEECVRPSAVVLEVLDEDGPLVLDVDDPADAVLLVAQGPDLSAVAAVVVVVLVRRGGGDGSQQEDEGGEGGVHVGSLAARPDTLGKRWKIAKAEMANHMLSNNLYRELSEIRRQRQLEDLKVANAIFP